MQQFLLEIYSVLVSLVFTRFLVVQGLKNEYVTKWSGIWVTLVEFSSVVWVSVGPRVYG
jgi:hypothetical protein